MRASSILGCLLAGAALAACDLAPPPPADPDAAAGAPRAKTAEHELQQGIDAIDHRDKAAAAGDAVKEADARREQALKDAGG